MAAVSQLADMGRRDPPRLRGLLGASAMTTITLRRVLLEAIAAFLAGFVIVFGLVLALGRLLRRLEGDLGH